jgi:hypothetical protein
MMRDLAKAIAVRRDQINKLQAEIDALDMAGKILKPTRSVKKKDSVAKATARKKRRKMSQTEKKAVSERMRAYWANKRKKSSKKT